MWQNLTSLSVSPWNLVIRGSVVYISVLVLLRLGGKRQLGQMTATEFVAVLLISNAVQNAMNAGDNSLLGGMILAVVLVFASWSISMLTFHSRKMRRIFEGTPTLLIHNGKPIAKNLTHERISENELKTLVRKHGFSNLSEIKSAILESDGTLTVTKAEE